MGFVSEVEPAQAGPELKEIYRNLEQGLGFLPHYFMSLGAKPKVIEAQLAMDNAIMSDGALTKIVKEQVAVIVSSINSSSYCVKFHMELLRRFGIDRATERKLTTDYENGSFEPKVKGLFRFAEKLTKTPDDILEKDIDALKEAGWDDAAIRETVLTVAYFGYINRVSLGLGLVTDL
jgi:uncharacterized peroxidase-related enzyme